MDLRTAEEDTTGDGLRVERDRSPWLLAGSVPEAAGRGRRRAYNTALLFDARGRLVASYRKLHLFDPHGVPGVGAAESDHVLAGRRPVVADTPWGRLGLSICYDLRFPELYRALAVAGAEILVVPAAFTAHTGRLHWELLLRARAVENTCYVAAAAQVGRHYGSRASWGQAMVVDPWGRVLAQAPSQDALAGVARPGRVALATCQAAVPDEARRTLPCLRQRRLAISPRPVRAGPDGPCTPPRPGRCAVSAGPTSCWPSAGRQ